MSRFARLENLLPADPMVLLQLVAQGFSESCKERFGYFAARLGFAPCESASSRKGVVLLRERGEEGGFVRLLLLLLIRMEVILLFQLELGERFGFEAGLTGVGSKGGTAMS